MYLFLFIYLAVPDLWLQYVGSSSLTRNRIWAPCIGSWNLNHWTTREVPKITILTVLTNGKYECKTGRVTESGYQIVCTH